MKREGERERAQEPRDLHDFLNFLNYCNGRRLNGIHHQRRCMPRHTPSVLTENITLVFDQ